jgi:hypothetical protein
MCEDWGCVSRVQVPLTVPDRLLAGGQFMLDTFVHEKFKDTKTYIVRHMKWT